MKRFGCIVLALFVTASPGLGQGFCFDEIDAVVDTQTGALEFTLPALGPIVSTPTLGVAEADVVGSTALDVLYHDATTIRWLDGATFATGVFQPAPPVAIMALAGLQTSATGTPLLFALASNGSDLYSIDLAALGNGWIGPSPLGFVAVSMTAVDVVGSTDEDLVLTDGVNVAAFDGATGVFSVLPAPPALTAIDSVQALYIGIGIPQTSAVGLLLGVNGTGPAGAVTYAYDKPNTVWFTQPIPRRYRIQSGTHFDNPDPVLAKGGASVPLANPITLAFNNLAAGNPTFAATTLPGGDDHCPGAVFTDLNNDGNADLYLARGTGASGSAQNQLFYGNGAGGFTQQFGFGAEDAGNGAGALALDYNNDRLMDLYVLNMDGDNKLYRQRPAGVWSDVTGATDPTPLDPVGDLQEGLRAAIPDLANGGRCPPMIGIPSPGPQVPCEINDTLTAAAGDFDRDGLIDIFVGGHLCCGYVEGERDTLYLQGPVGVFTDITFRARITKPNVPQHDSTQSVIVDDFNNDQWPDIYVTVKTDGPTRDHLYLNNGPGITGAWSGTFTDWLVNQGQLGNVSPAAMGIDSGDVDNDGDLDIFITDLGPSADYYLNTTGPGPGTFGLQLVVPNPAASPYWTWGATWSDFDNDSDLDLHVTSELYMMDWMWRNDGSGVFADVAFDAGVGIRSTTRGNIPADLDGDGLLDLVVIDKLQPLSLFQNQSATGNNWFGLRLIGNPNPPAPAPYTSTLGAVGARVDLTAAGITQRRDVKVGGITCGSTRDYVLHFGLGTAPAVSGITISWPSGQTTTLPNAQVPVIPINGVLTVTEP